MKLKKFEQQPKHVDNIPIEAINLDSEQEQPPKPDKAVGKNVTILQFMFLHLTALRE